MARNDFRTFGSGTPPNDGGPSANTLSNAAYGSLAARTTGFQSGIARSVELNKVWRQSSLITSMIGQFMADTGFDAVDDGSITTLEANFINAIHAITQIKVVAPNLQFYVSVAGSDSNDGTTQQTPWRNVQTAIARVYSLYNFQGNAVTINVAPGTYAENVLITGAPIGCRAVTIVGDENNPGGVVISGSNAACFQITSTAVEITIAGMTLTSAGGNAWGVNCVQSAVIIRNMLLSSCANPQVESSTGGVVFTQGTIHFNGSNNWGFFAQTGGGIEIAAATVLDFQAPNYAQQFLTGTLNGTIQLTPDVTLVGSFSGKSFLADRSGAINVFGRGPAFYPNNIVGTVDTGSFGFYG